MAGKSFKEEADAKILTAGAHQAAKENLHGARVVKKGSQERAGKKDANSAVLPRASLSSNHLAHKSAGIK